MATRDCIAALSTALVGVLEEALRAPGGLGGEVQLYTSLSFSTPMQDGLSVLLYRLVYDPIVWNHPPRLGESGPRITLTAYYAVNAWSRSAIRQQQLLGFAAETLAQTPVLASDLLNRHAPAANVFSPGEAVTIVNDAPSPSDLAGVPGIQGWSVPVLFFAARGLTFGSV